MSQAAFHNRAKCVIVLTRRIFYLLPKLNTIKEVSTAIEKEVKEKGSTLWGLFNGITYYTNHIANHKTTKEDYVMTGSGYEKNRLGFNEIMRWTEEELV